MHISDDELAAHYYGELSEAAETKAAAHLEECEVCRASLAKLKRVMAAIDMVTMPEPPAEFEQNVWRRLQPAVNTERPGDSGMSAWKLGAWGSMAAGIILAAFVAGRMWPNRKCQWCQKCQQCQWCWCHWCGCEWCRECWRRGGSGAGA